MADDKRKNNKRGIATLSDLSARGGSDSDSDDPQEYYTGGEKSGMMVQDPSKPPKRDTDTFFERARQHVVPGASPPTLSDDGGSFSGTGRTLAGAVREPPPPPVMHTITLWRNGFTVNDGPLRQLNDPANADFVKSIVKGQVPRELISGNQSPQQHIDINLVRRDEEYKESSAAPAQRSFQGTGRTLGSNSLTTPSEPLSATAAVNLVSAEPFRGIVVDEGKPFTTLQLRLADGTRMVARFNTYHTVADVRGFINAARLDGPKQYALQTMGFPPKLLNDPSLTIEAAGLSNSVVIQKT